VITARDEAWEGLVVLGADRRSTLRHVRIAHVMPRPRSLGPRREGWLQTGGLVFGYSDLVASHLHLHDFGTEDGLNVIGARLELEEALFERVASDALDGDFVTGHVARTSIRDAGGDGLDFSGSRVELRDIATERVRDKAVSVGEGSEIALAGLQTRGGRFAVVSKDGSRVEAEGIDVDDTWVALAAFTKKTEYGAAQLHARDLSLAGRSFAHLAQDESVITLDGARLPARRFDTADLYAP
jgi:hypothetical protein